MFCYRWNQELLNFRIQGELPAQFRNPFITVSYYGLVFGMAESIGHYLSDNTHLFFLHAPGSQRRCSKTDTAGNKGAFRFIRNRIFVYGNMNGIQYFFCGLARKVLVPYVKQDQVGPPCMPGNTALSMALAYFSLQRISPPRGPRRVLCVVVVTTSASGTGLGWKPAATRPAI